MGERLVKMLNCEDKEEGYIDSDEDENKVSPNSSNKSFEKAFKNTNDIRQNAPPPTAIDPLNTQGNPFDQSMKQDAFNQSSVGMLKQEADYTPASQNLSLKKNSLIDMNAIIETNENIRKAGISIFNENDTPDKVELFLENNEKNENDSEKEMIKRSPNKINSIVKSPSKNEENGKSEGFYLPNQVREERKDIFMQENSQIPENDEEFQRGGSIYPKKEKASSNPSETLPDMLFQKVSAKVAEII